MQSTQNSVLLTCDEIRKLEDGGDFDGALELLTPLWEGRGGLEECETANVLLRMGSLSSRAGLTEQHVAKDWLSQSYRIFEEYRYPNKAAESCVGMAMCCWREGNFEDARIWLRYAADRVSADNLDLKCRVTLMSGILEKDAGNLHTAIDILRAGAPLIEALGNHALKAKYHNEHGLALTESVSDSSDSSVWDLALIELTAASYHYEQARNYRAAAIVENNMAFLLLKLKRLVWALKHIAEAVRLAEAHKDKLNVAQFEETRAQILLGLGRHPEALEAANKSVNLLRFGGERALLANSLTTCARCLARSGNTVKAFQKFHEAKEVAEFIDYQVGLGLVSLAMLEEIGDMDFNSRREHHLIVARCLNSHHDDAVRQRHQACLRQTFGLMMAEMGLEEERAGEAFSWDEFSLDAAVDDFEKFWIRSAMEDANGCQRVAARLLKITDSNLNHKLKTKHKDLKRLQTKGHYRTSPAEERSAVSVYTVPDDSMSGLGIGGGDSVVIKSKPDVKEGEPVAVRSRKKIFLGLYQKVEGGIALAPASEAFETWYFEEGTFEIVGGIKGYIKKTDKARVLTL